MLRIAGNDASSSIFSQFSAHVLYAFDPDCFGTSHVQKITHARRSPPKWEKQKACAGLTESIC